MPHISCLLYKWHIKFFLTKTATAYSKLAITNLNQKWFNEVFLIF